MAAHGNGPLRDRRTHSFSRLRTRRQTYCGGRGSESRSFRSRSRPCFSGFAFLVAAANEAAHLMGVTSKCSTWNTALSHPLRLSYPHASSFLKLDVRLFTIPATSLFPRRNAARCWASTMFHVEHCLFDPSSPLPTTLLAAYSQPNQHLPLSHLASLAQLFLGKLPFRPAPSLPPRPATF